MNRTNRKMLAWIAAAVITAAPAVFAGPHEGHDHRAMHYGGHDGGINPLIEEMRQLDKVFSDIVSGVALGDGARVRAAVESLHGSMEKTHEGLHAGKVTIAKNPKRVNDFVRMDKEFHGRLEMLAHAADRNNQRRMLTLTKQLLEGCVSCHQTFRQ